MELSFLIVEVALTILAADLASGLVHWAEDTLWTEDAWVVGRWIVQPNVLHHHDASAFTKQSWLRSCWDSLAVGVFLVCAAAILNVLTWQVWFFVVLGVNANQFHKWAHTSVRKVPFWVRCFQRLRLLQRPRHHVAHHRGEKNTTYCVITEFLNPYWIESDCGGRWTQL
jgi:ubiquitin-conjugating enzyme E2 variant